MTNLIDNDDWYDPKLAGYWIWASSCWIGSGLTRPNAIPHLSDAGKGVHKGKIPHLSDAGKGVHVQRPIYDWFNALSQRLRRVRVVCGEWDRVCGGDWQDNMGTVGIFFDPPYGVSDRDTSVYHHDSIHVAADVLEWARGRGQRNSYRIVLAGYQEYEDLIKEGWTKEAWKASGGYGNQAQGQGKANAHRETLYFSPHCLINKEKPKTLFNLD